MSAAFRFISAGAGSGKTHRLTELLHEMLLDRRVRPSGVIATTFTNKAAAELRARVRSHLIRKGQYRLATAIGESRIGTVNSVCGGLLARFAFEAGLAPEQRVLDEPRAARILEESIDEVVEGSILTDLLGLVRRLSLDKPGFGSDEIPWQQALRDIVRQARANSIDADRLRTFGTLNADHVLAHLPRPSKCDHDGDLRRALEGAIPVIREGAARLGRKNTAEYLRLIERAARDLRSGDLTWAQWNSLAGKEPEAALRSVAEPVKDAAAAHPSHPELHGDIRRYLVTLFALAADVLDKYRERKVQLSAIDFTDQERELLNVIDRPDIAETLRAELDLLMVDEFQDTSPIQLALFLKLARLARHVVWVGDVKQAIYAFRGGDDELMTAVVDRLPALGADKEILPFSWRSRPSLVGFVNEVFGPAFPNLPRAEVELKPKRPEFDGTPAIDDWILDGNAAEQQQAIAFGIAELLRDGTRVTDKDSEALRPIRLGDIAILARSNNTVNAMARALREMGLPVSTEQPGLMERPEIVLALACLRRLNDEGDTISTAEIVSLAGCQRADSWLADRLAWLDQGNRSTRWREEGGEVHPIFTALQRLREQRPVLSPREAVELVVAHCDLCRHVLQWQQSAAQARARLANLEQLLTFAAEYEDECRSGQDVATLSGFLLWMQELGTGGLDKFAQPAGDAVRVMTHHASKGLEWPVVVLMDLAGNVKDAIWDSVRAEAPGTLDVERPLHERFLRLWPWPYGGQGNEALTESVAASDAGRKLRSRAIEEHKRVLYVSLTRARDVVVLARAQKKLDGEWMSTVGLADRLPPGDATALGLPSGASVPYRRRARTAAGVPPEGQEPTSDLHWFVATGVPTPRLPLQVSPSSMGHVPARVVETIRIGSPIQVQGSPEPAALGEAVHACLAAQFVVNTEPLTVPDLQAILSRMGMSGALDPEALRRQIGALSVWIHRRWPDAKPSVEVPLSRSLPNGQRVSGRADLLLRSDKGWVLFDHKSWSQEEHRWHELAEAYGGQLAAYRESIEAVTGVPVVESWLLLPVAGACLRVEDIPK